MKDIEKTFENFMSIAEELEPETPIDYSKLVKRETYGEGEEFEGEEYYIDPSKVIEIYHDGEPVDYKNLSYSDMNFVDSLIDSFEEGYNHLEEANGELTEVMTSGVWKLMREAVRA